MKMKKVLAVALTAALLTSSVCSLGSVSASADEATDYSSYATYSGSDLGATYSKDSTTFKVWAPTSTDVKVMLYTKGSAEEEGGETPVKEAEMSLDKATGVWSCTVDGDLKNTYYTYYLKNDLSPDGVEVCDVYAKAAGVNGNRAMVVDLDSTDPAGWEEDSFQRVEEPTDAVVWEIHVKDFSYDPESGVSDANRGKYMAFTEFETTLNNAGDVKTCMNYLKDLGISYVQINPMYDFASVDEAGDDTQFNWGYDPKNYNVPEGSYSSNPYDGNVRINEMKQMIQALHDNGIGVIMDVVYNHTYASEDSWFNLTVPGYYYRQTATGAWSNGSGCGNDTASEREMFKNYMVDSITYWATEYHLDGFRFDLMGLHDCDTMNAVRAALDNIDTKIITYGEGWTMGTSNDAYNWTGEKTTLCTQSKAMRINERIGFFNDDARDAIKGKAFDDLTSRGYVSGSVSKANELMKSITGHFTNANWKTQVPGQNVMYSCCHDNQTLWDRLTASEFGVDGDYASRYEKFVSSNKLAGAIILTSQGIPFMLAGEEFARTKYGDHNSYKSSPDINMLDWSRVQEYADIVAYYKGLIDIRQNFDAFSDGTRTTGKAITTLENLPAGVIGYSVDNIEKAETIPSWEQQVTSNGQWNNAIVLFNGSLTDSYDISLPGGGSGLLGDIDGNGSITVSDAVEAMKCSLKLVELTDTQKILADIDGDGNISVGDSTEIMKIAVKLKETTSVGGTDYVVVADKQTAGLSAIRTVSGTVNLEANSALILVPKDSYEAAKKSDEENAYVVVNHVDVDTGEVLYKTTIKGTEGQKYTTQQATDLLVEYDFDSASDNTSGTMTAGTTNVYYYYKIYAGGIGTLTVRYVDEKGKDLCDPITSTARGGTAYTTEAKKFAWYKLDDSQLPANASGEYVKEGVEVVYHYVTSEETVKSTIHVKLAEGTEFTPYLHLWDGTTKFPAPTTWPGIKLTEKDQNGWYSCTFENGGAYNWILNDGQGTQTADMTNYSGDIWVVATGSASNVTAYDHNPDLQ